MNNNVQGGEVILIKHNKMDTAERDAAMIAGPDTETAERDAAMIAEATQNSTNFYLLIGSQVVHLCVILWLLVAFPSLLQPFSGLSTVRFSAAVLSGWTLIGVKCLLGSACVYATVVNEKEAAEDAKEKEASGSGDWGDWIVLDE